MTPLRQQFSLIKTVMKNKKQEESDTNSDEFSEENEYEKVSRTKLEDEMMKCYAKYNAHDREKQSERSLSAIEMKSFMYAALNSESCLRRSASALNFNPNVFCDPLVD